MLTDRGAVLVTGASGFVGARVCRGLASAGLPVRALVRSPGRTPMPEGHVEEFVGDVADASAVARAVESVVAVVHCAAATRGDRDFVRRVNTEGTRVVAHASHLAGVGRFVHMSTCSVYDRGALPVVDETTPRRKGGDPYSLTKVEAEVVIEQARTDGLATTILRPPAVLGWAPSSIWGQMYPEMLRTGTLPFTPNPDSVFPWVHVDDLVRAVLLVLAHDHEVGRTYNVIGGHETWRAYVDTLRRFMDLRHDPFEEGVPRPRTGRIDGRRLREELGFEPQHSFDEAMKEIAANL